MRVALNMTPQAEVKLDVLANPPSDNISVKNRHVGGIQALCSSAATAPQKLAKRPTRQWAAWTRQEEERFFNALRQFGKNFEKITFQVQTKNKDQVRHYYYRLVRRMNKLLGPGFSLDAKNSKDTNAAMLRWWSLLEKYSCSASKFHLKPRRFKIFIETLAQQLLKDRNKTRKKIAFQGENCSSISLTADSTTSKPIRNDVHTVKLVIVDDQSIQKLGYMKGRSRKRGVSAAVNGNKEDLSTTMKTERQKRRTADYTEDARVFDATEHLEKVTNDGNGSYLERATNDGNGSLEKGTIHTLLQNGDFVQHCPTAVSGRLCSQQQVGKTNMQTLSKLKLQLFPVDEGTQKAMERNEHNPHLELTLSTRKRVASIIEHLNRKWGKLSIASGELVLFPYGIQWDNIASCPRWTLRDTTANAGDVHASLGSPPIFRLSYGWFSSLELQPGNVHSSSSAHHLHSCMQTKDSLEENHVGVSSEQAVKIDTEVGPCSPGRQASGQLPYAASADDSMVSKSKPHVDASVQIREETVDDKEQHGEMVATLATCSTQGNQRASDDASVPAGDWADILTNISIGDLLSETSTLPDSCHTSPPAEGNAPSLQPISFSCDSFDAAIAKFLSGRQDIAKSSSCSSPKSFLNAEDTCDEFLFDKVAAINQENLNTSSGACRQLAPADPCVLQNTLNDFVAETRCVDDPPCKGDIEADLQFDEQLVSDDKLDPGKNVTLTDMYWPDSLGSLNLDISCTRKQGMGVILSESFSLSSLCSFMANSCDAFHNCSLFSPEERITSS